MIITIMVLFISSLLLVAAFTAANGDIKPAHLDLTQKQAYYAALAGVQEYEYKLEADPNYWQKCPAPAGTLAGEGGAAYAVTTLAASTDPEAEKKCNASNPFSTIIESSGSLANTFRVRSTGTSGKSSRSVVANFQVAGFLNYIYFTQYEVADPESYSSSANEKKYCGTYRPQREKLEAKYGFSCEYIDFGPKDAVNGPMHTDDKAAICGGASFGRENNEPPDAVEMNLGYSLAGCGSGSPKFNVPNGKPTEGGQELVPPPSDTSLSAYVEHEPQENEFTGLTYLELEGKTNEIKVTKYVSGVPSSKKIEWPKNGLIYVSQSGPCAYSEFDQENTDTAATLAKEENCGSVYVKGTSSATKSLTIGAEEDLIVDGKIVPYGTTPPAAPPSTTTVGLIASRFVRMYHPCSSNVNRGGPEMENPWIYAAILSTSHSFLVDNYKCGSSLGKLNIYGAIGQKWRGIVGIIGTSGYDKNYVYDERLATDEPPYFLAPLKAGWKIARETANQPG